MHDHLTRQFDLIPLGVLSTPLHVVGAGAVGSFTVLALAKMGFTDITVYDDDTVSVENMNCQFYRFSDIGQPKVQALASIVRDFTGLDIRTVQDRVGSGFRPTGILVAAVDSMESRINLWSSNEFNGGLLAFIDPRMAAEELAIRTVVPLSVRAGRYPASLHSDAEAVPERCTAKATMYTSLLISGLVCATVKQLLCNPSYVHSYTYDIGTGDMQSYI